MNILFLTMSRISGISNHGIYSDLMRRFRDEGHSVFIVHPHERFLGKKTDLYDTDGAHILGVKTLNLQKTNVIEKGIGQVLVEPLFKAAINKYLKGIRFDLILYSTPPITFPKVIKFLRRTNPQAKTYLLLKDIFPQNAVDLGLMNKNGLKGIIYRFFRNKEKTLYQLSDNIGCMSPANVAYVLKHNPEIPKERVEVAPNSLELTASPPVDSIKIRQKYGLPYDKPIFIYGGNLGKPQGIPFLIDCLEANSSRDDCHFVIIGTGTELPGLLSWYERKQHKSVTVLNGVPRDEYDSLVQSCDVGLVFLDHRFTIPNFPSRLLSYLEFKLPVLCATDPYSDMGRIAETNGFGFWCESNSIEAFSAIVDKMIQADRGEMGEKGYHFLFENYQIQNTFDAIMRHV